jgi:hypothetical protein
MVFLAYWFIGMNIRTYIYKYTIIEFTHTRQYTNIPINQHLYVRVRGKKPYTNIFMYAMHFLLSEQKGLFLIWKR